MANDRGTYGSRDGHRSSPLRWIVGAAAVGGALLWMRHVSREIEVLYKHAGLPHQSFTQGLRADARALPGRTRAALRGFARGDGEPRHAELGAPAEERGT